MNKILGCVVATSFFATTSAVAAPVVTPGNNPQDDSNVIFNGCGPIGDALPNTEFGCLNDGRSIFVNLTSDEPIDASGGQASVEAQDGLFSNLSISFQDGGYISTLILNIDAATPVGTVQFEFGIPSMPALLSALFPLNANGNNFFTLTGGPFTYVAFRTYRGAPEADVVDDVKQIRIGTYTPSASVPEPGSLALLGLGILGLASIGRRRM